MSRAKRLLGALGALAGAACGGQGTAPSLAAPEPPAVVVTFPQDAVGVREGETAAIAVNYRINSLASPLSMTVSPLNQGATPDDYELSATRFEIPAGQGVTGSAELSLTALADDHIAEGAEVVGLRLLPPGGVRAQLDENLEITIADAPGVPCLGVQVQGSRIVRLKSADHYLTTTVALSRDPAARRVGFNWEGPYRHDEDCDDDECREFYETRSPVLEVNVVEWRIESSSGSTTHSMDIEWLESRTAGLRFHSPDGGCGEKPAITCTRLGCELIP